MPHCVIEYAQDLEQSINIQSLVQTVHQQAIASSLFNTPAIKTRAIAYQDYLVGEGKSSFIHVTLHILNGRTIEQKQLLSELVLKEVTTVFSEVDNVSVNVVDMEKQTYRKT